jgi:tritrans,polycis-undecaprenyl-diphosphate synthase [geranylgeranyl-diphosphate specific]
LSFAKWCLAEHIPQLTVYALSTENWARHPAEIQHLMDIIQKHCQELRAEAIRRSIRVCIVSTNAHAIPQHVRNALEELRRDTQHGQRLRLNICLSYGGRGEIVAACQNILNQQQQQQQQPLNNNKMHDIRHPPKPITVTEQMIEQSLQLPSSPDVLIRTSNEYRLSNFLLWQLAYTELFFLDKYWPQVQKQDLLDVLREYAKRQRRYGK